MFDYDEELSRRSRRHADLRAEGRVMKNAHDAPGISFEDFQLMLKDIPDPCDDETVVREKFDAAEKANKTALRAGCAAKPAGIRGQD